MVTSKGYVLWHMDPLHGNDLKTNNETTAVLGSGPHTMMEVLLEVVFSM
jgi:3-deoxy-D-arabino-heptulosonate 7-phosphate (DAHP) synthase class II